VARAAVACAREQQRGCPSELVVSFDICSGATVQPIENPLAILLANLVQQLTGADGSGFGSGLSAEEVSHSFRKLAVLHDGSWTPCTGVSSGPTLPPPSCDHDEVMLAKDRVPIVAGGSDAAGGGPLDASLRTGVDLGEVHRPGVAAVGRPIEDRLADDPSR
jgi:hypothetical protein